jgi:stage V sporulation protein R
MVTIMELIDQHTKKIMEGCKEQARDAGLRFQDESLEYIVTNRDLLEISPKMMIPTLYDYWVHDVEVLKEKGKYELYPGNPYETVINTRPAISFYNDNNPDWLNVMIFYHVLGHIDFFQNNAYFRHTWDYDFTGQALSDKRVIARLRSEKGRWVDYVIEFTRSIDNLVGYHDELSRLSNLKRTRRLDKLDFYFDIFLQDVLKAKTSEYIKEIERFNQCRRENKSLCREIFFEVVGKGHPEFEAMFKKYKKKKPARHTDPIQFLLAHSEFLNKEENQWMKIVMQIVRKTSLFFQPQIRSKIMNEGWASYWHETLFLQDRRIKGHEVEFARVNANVTALPRVGLNPYALGMRLFYHIEEMADKGRYEYPYQRIRDRKQRMAYNAKTGEGRNHIFNVRENYCDAMFIHDFLDQQFITKHRLFVAGQRPNKQKMVWEYYVKSRKRKDYVKMLENSLYHPPHITVDFENGDDRSLYLVHHFEEKPLIKEFIAGTLMGLEYLWGGVVKLETHEVVSVTKSPDTRSRFTHGPVSFESDEEPTVEWHRVLYKMENKKLTRKEF